LSASYSIPKMNQTEIDQLYTLFSNRKMPKKLWTHRAHFIVATCLLLDPVVDEPMNTLRDLIKSNNLYMGVENTDSGGYHETLTWFYFHAIKAILSEKPGLDRYSAVETVLQSPIVDKSYPLKFYEKVKMNISVKLS